MDEACIDRAFVVGLPEVAPNDFVLEACKRNSTRLIPVGSFNPISCHDEMAVMERARCEFKDHGFAGIKLHPRFHRYNILDRRVQSLFDEFSTWDSPPVIWLCTFFYYNGGVLPKSPVEMIHEVVGRYPNLKFILLHGGGPDLLRLAFALRDTPNAYLDLSYTMCKYRASSVESDIRYLLSTFDRRMVFGSDFPEINLKQAVTDFEDLSIQSPPHVRENVLSKNLITLFGKDKF